MAETKVKTQICKTCDADIRQGALFCYNCGNSVAPDIVVVQKSNSDGKDKILKKEIVAENGNGISQKISKNKAEVKDENLISNTEVQPDKNLKSAASLRKKTKSIQKKKVEIVWEEHENAPNGWFITATIVLAIFAFLIFWLAFYFR